MQPAPLLLPRPGCSRAQRCSSPRERHRLHLFWYISVGSFNLRNRLREDFIQRGESNYHFICNPLPFRGLHPSELEGPGSPRAPARTFLQDGFVPLPNASADARGFSAAVQRHFSPPSCFCFYLTACIPHEENNWI